MWAAIEAAEREVCLVTYILKDDEVGRRTIELLMAASRRGCRVRLLYDDAGNITGRTRLVAPLLAERNATVYRYRPMTGAFLTYFLSGLDWNVSPAVRNHRKLLVVDQEVAFAGGLNVGNEYAGRDCSTPGLLSGKFRDTMVRVTGESAAQLQRLAEEVLAPPGPCADRAERESWAKWNSTPRITRVSDPPLPQQLPPAALAEPYEPPAEIENCSEVEVLGSNCWLRDYSIQKALTAALRGSTERVWFTTPYFTPPDRLFAEIEAASRRGVDVRIVVGGRKCTDPPGMWWVEQRWYRRALEAGIRIFEFQSPGEVMHAKLWTIDGGYGSVGSFNLDLLSDFLLEANVAARDKRFAGQLERQFLRDSARGNEVTLAELDERQQDPLFWTLSGVCCSIVMGSRWIFAPNFDDVRDA
eukprot:Hpha_TRINITY_DN16902_c2_g4::TRINITY_DN16902_c2_g4_i1::g.55754::m.55754/K06131/clsA_B; cardiolipin synthase A/B